MKREDFVKISIALPIFIQLLGCKDEVSNKKLFIRKIPQVSDSISEKDLAFLLRRTTFGFSHTTIEEYKKLNLEEILKRLFEVNKTPSPPVNFEFKNDKYTPLGQTWIDKPYLKKIFFEQYRKKSIQAWAHKVIFEERDVSITEQMTLFWHNHYGVSDIVEHKYEYVHNSLLRENFIGNYKELTKKIVIDPAMLRFLSGFENTRKAPNENFARELLELFTIGKGKLIGDGDYTNYSEHDVMALSKIFTGWTDIGWYANYKNIPIGAEFKILAHDPLPVRLSKNLGNKLIPPLFHQRYSYIVDHLFTYNETAKFIVRKIYRWFVNNNINHDTEKNIIEPLSITLIQNNFSIKSVLNILFRSKHFFEQQYSTNRSKNPIEYIHGLLKYFPINIPNNLENEYNFWHQIFTFASEMGMEYFKPPSVAGWKAYYQAPLYSNLWINAATLNNKQLFCEKLFIKGFEYKNSIVKIDIKKWLSRYRNNMDIHYIIHQINLHLFIIPFDKYRVQAIKAIFFGDGDEKTWKYQALNYISCYENYDNSFKIFENNCRNALKYIFSTPEFLLI